MLIISSLLSALTILMEGDIICGTRSGGGPETEIINHVPSGEDTALTIRRGRKKAFCLSFNCII